MDRAIPSPADFLAPTPATAESEDARRREPRRRSLLVGKLVFGVHDLTADCAIRNLTAGGAKVQTSVAASLPGELWLIIVHRGLAHRARLAWRRDQEVGLKFLSDHNLAESRDPQLAMVRHVWRQLTDR